MESWYNEIETVILLSTLCNMKSFKKFSKLYHEPVLSTVWYLFSDNEIPTENLQ